MTIELNPNYLKALLNVSSKEETRYYLCGVHVYNKDDMLIYEATNGKSLVRLHEVNKIGADINVIISNATLKKLKPKRRGIEMAIFDGENLSYDGIEYKSCTIDGNFPDCDRVIPDYTDVEGVRGMTINTSLLDDIGKAYKQAYQVKNSIVQIVTGETERAPLLVKSSGFHDDDIAVLMPCKS